MLSDDEIKAYCKRLATFTATHRQRLRLAATTAAHRQRLRLAALTASRKLDWRLAGSFILFQMLNLACVLLAVAVGLCLFSFLLAMEGQTTQHLLPWFLLMAVPLWLAASYWVYSYLVLRGVLLPELAKTATRPANDAVPPEAQTHADTAVDKPAALRRGTPS